MSRYDDDDFFGIGEELDRIFSNFFGFPWYFQETVVERRRTVDSTSKDKQPTSEISEQEASSARSRVNRYSDEYGWPSKERIHAQMLLDEKNHKEDSVKRSTTFILCNLCEHDHPARVDCQDVEFIIQRHDQANLRSPNIITSYGDIIKEEPDLEKLIEVLENALSWENRSWRHGPSLSGAEEDFQKLAQERIEAYVQIGKLKQILRSRGS